MVRFSFRAATASVLLTLAAPTPADTGAAIRFVEPRPRATVVGSTTIRLAVRPAPGDASERVDVRIDGRLVATLVEPPWVLEWDAGDGSNGHHIQAMLTTASGETASATLQTSPLRVNQIESVDLVNLYLIARDRRGDYITGLEQGDFRVYENGERQTIERFSTHHKPLRVAIVLDTSHSMEGEKLERAQRAALGFLEILEADDEGIVVTFSDEVVFSQEKTGSAEALSSAIEGTEAGGGTALYDAVWRTSRRLEDFDGRRVLVLLSDGQDESYTGLEPGSIHTLDEALEQALRSEVMVFSIGLGRDLDREYVRRWHPGGLSNLDTSTSLADVLERFSGSTGGRALLSPGAGKLRKAFEEIADDLRNQYSIAYVSTDPARDGRWREVRVEVPSRSVDIVTRKGYYARKPTR